MNKKAMGGKALTLLGAAGIIALLFFIFIFVLNIGTPDKALSIKENLDGLSKSGQLRVIISHSADDLALGKPGNVPAMLKQAYGTEVLYALYVNNNIISGTAVSKAKSSIETLVPRYDGDPVSVKLEVAQ
jgi:hypothetical protein